MRCVSAREAWRIGERRRGTGFRTGLICDAGNPLFNETGAAAVFEVTLAGARGLNDLLAGAAAGFNDRKSGGCQFRVAGASAVGCQAFAAVPA